MQTVIEMPPNPSLCELLRTEFEMAQSKIDNIGEFKFRVRGWSLTLQTAIIAALLSGKLSETISSTVLAILGFTALGVIFLFHLLEQQQDNLGRALGRRAFALENALDALTIERRWSPRKKERTVETALRELGGSPRIASTLSLAARQPFLSTLSHMFWPIRPNIFYLLQYALTTLAIGAICLSKPSSPPTEQAASSASMSFRQVIIEAPQQKTQQIQKTEIAPVYAPVDASRK